MRYFKGLFGFFSQRIYPVGNFSCSDSPTLHFQWPNVMDGIFQSLWPTSSVQAQWALDIPLHVILNSHVQTHFSVLYPFLWQTDVLSNPGNFSLHKGRWLFSSSHYVTFPSVFLCVTHHLLCTYLFLSDARHRVPCSVSQKIFFWGLRSSFSVFLSTASCGFPHNFKYATLYLFGHHLLFRCSYLSKNANHILCHFFVRKENRNSIYRVCPGWFFFGSTQ